MNTSGAMNNLYLTAITHAGQRLLSVGERGSIIYSDDNGKNWSASQTGLADTLTDVSFFNDSQGIAVGHGGNILKTNDAGSSWKRVLDGKELIHLTTQAAKQVDDAKDPVQQPSDLQARFEAYADRLQRNGSSEPLFSIRFLTESTAYAVGAYGMILKTEDGGETWEVWMTHVDNPQELHLYAFMESEGILYLAGEQGFLAKSTDQGEHFSRIETSAAGSFFTMAADKNGVVYAAGLQGQLIRSADHGQSWQAVKSDDTTSWIASQLDSQGNVVFGDMAGHLFKVNNASLVPIPTPSKSPLAGFVANGLGSLVLVGGAGIQVISANSNSVLEVGHGTL